MAKIDPEEQLGMVVRGEYDDGPGRHEDSRKRFRWAMNVLQAELKLQRQAPLSQSKMTAEDAWVANRLSADLGALGADIQRIRATQSGSAFKRGRM